MLLGDNQDKTDSRFEGIVLNEDIVYIDDDENDYIEALSDGRIVLTQDAPVGNDDVDAIGRTQKTPYGYLGESFITESSELFINEGKYELIDEQTLLNEELATKIVGAWIRTQYGGFIRPWYEFYADGTGISASYHGTTGQRYEGIIT